MSGPTIDRANSSGDIWTPQVFRDAVVRKFGFPKWDLACSKENRFGKFGIYGETVDSLTQNWHKFMSQGRDDPKPYHPLCYLNPPFANITPWARKCAEEWKLGAEILLLVPMGSQNWYWDYVEPFAQVYCVGRMVFDNCFDRKTGELVTTPYAKDLILAHYDPLTKPVGKPVRWRWENDN